MTLLEALYDAYVRPLNLQLSWRLNESSRNRLLLAGALPAIVIAGQITAAALSYIFSPSELYYGEFLEGGPGEFWRLLYRATTTLSVLQPAAVGALFFAGMRRWSRDEGSWMLLVGAALAGVAILLGCMATVVLTATEDQDLIDDLRVNLVSTQIAQAFGFLSVGFFFVAYRGLAPDTRSGPRTRLRRSEATPPSLPRHSGALVCALHAFAPCG